MTETTVSVIIPCYNEEKTIVQLLEAIRGQTYPIQKMEVVIADALSQDRTRERIGRYQLEHADLKVTVVDNPRRVIPAGLNLAIANSTGEVILRMDAHAIPAADYVERCLADLDAGLGANVGGVIDIKPGRENWIGRSIAVAAAHPLGVGDAYYRWATKPTEADTVAFGAYKRSLYERVGKFDETLLANEDYEWNTRVRASGGRIWIDPSIRAVYYARADLRSLSKQYFTYGFWKYRMLRRYPGTLRWRQALPPLFVLGILMLLLLFTFWKLARIILLVVALLYTSILIAGTIKPAIREKRFSYLAGVPLAIMTMHFSWGAGFWWSMLTKGRTE